jgi:hypothetical protein
MASKDKFLLGFLDFGLGVNKFELKKRQLSLFEETGEGKVEKLRRLSQAVDRIREKYGDEAIRRASLVTASSPIHR